MSLIVDGNDILEMFKVKMGNAKFNQKDIRVMNNSWMIIFLNEENKSLIGKSKIWICEGTFKTVPNNIYKVFIIHCLFIMGFYP